MSTTRKNNNLVSSKTLAKFFDSNNSRKESIAADYVQRLKEVKNRSALRYE